MIHSDPIKLVDIVHEMLPICGIVESVQRTYDNGSPEQVTVSLVPDDNGRFKPEGEAIAKEITYTIALNHPQFGPCRVNGIEPANDREDEPMKIIPAGVGSRVVGTYCNQVVFLTIIERCGRKAACAPIQPTGVPQ